MLGIERLSTHHTHKVETYIAGCVDYNISRNH